MQWNLVGDLFVSVYHCKAKEDIHNKSLLCIFQSTCLKHQGFTKPLILKTQLEESIISGVVLLFDKFENEKIIWENKFLPDIIDFSGSMCTPFSLDIDMLTGQLFFTKNRLNDFADVYETKFRLFRELKLPELKSIANAELAEMFSF